MFCGNLLWPGSAGATGAGDGKVEDPGGMPASVGPGTPVPGAIHQWSQVIVSR